MQTPRPAARVMTWNIWWRFGPRWRDRQPGLVQTLREVDSDVVALQEVWGVGDTTQAHEFAEQLAMHAAYAAPGLPPPPVSPENEDQVGVGMGIGLLSRWPIRTVRRVEMPARHRSPAPVAMVASVEHPAGALHVVVACLEWDPAYNDDRIRRGTARFRSSWPATATPRRTAPCSDRCTTPSPTRGPRDGATRMRSPSPPAILRRRSRRRS